jgi:hypothetical protein
MPTSSLPATEPAPALMHTSLIGKGAAIPKHYDEQTLAKAAADHKPRVPDAERFESMFAGEGGDLAGLEARWVPIE